MRAVVLHAPLDLRIEEREVHAAGRRARSAWACARAASAARTCTTTCMAASARSGCKEPMILGHEVAGVIESVAPASTGEARPDRRGQSEPALPASAAIAAWACRTSASTCASTAAPCVFPHVQGGFREVLVCDAVAGRADAEGTSRSMKPLSPSRSRSASMPCAGRLAAWQAGARRRRRADRRPHRRRGAGAPGRRDRRHRPARRRRSPARARSAPTARSMSPRRRRRSPPSRPRRAIST